MEGVGQWIRETIGDDSLRQAANLAGLSPATLSRQVANESVTVETAVKIARTYQVSVIPALIILNVVTEDDISRFVSKAAVQDATDETLSTEVLRRMKIGSKFTANSKSQREAPTSVSADDSFDDDAIVARINAGVERVAAQRATPPIEEHFT